MKSSTLAVLAIAMLFVDCGLRPNGDSTDSRGPNDVDQKSDEEGALPEELPEIQNPPGQSFDSPCQRSMSLDEDQDKVDDPRQGTNQKKRKRKASGNGKGDTKTPCQPVGTPVPSIPVPGQTPVPSVVVVGFAAKIAPISLKSCEGAGCHSGASPAKGIALDSAAGWRLNFNGSLGSVQRGSMPLGRSPLTVAEILLLQQWKDSGFAN